MTQAPAARDPGDATMNGEAADAKLEWVAHWRRWCCLQAIDEGQAEPWQVTGEQLKQLAKRQRPPKRYFEGDMPQR